MGSGSVHIESIEWIYICGVNNAITTAANPLSDAGRWLHDCLLIPVERSHSFYASSECGLNISKATASCLDTLMLTYCLERVFYMQSRTMHFNQYIRRNGKLMEIRLGS